MLWKLQCPTPPMRDAKRRRPHLHIRTRLEFALQWSIIHLVNEPVWPRTQLDFPDGFYPVAFSMFSRGGKGGEGKGEPEQSLERHADLNLTVDSLGA